MVNSSNLVISWMVRMTSLRFFLTTLEDDDDDGDGSDCAAEAEDDGIDDEDAAAAADDDAPPLVFADGDDVSNVIFETLLYLKYSALKSKTTFGHTH
jgi:hypothetical protein